MDSDKLATAVLEEFVKKIRLASKSNQKEIKLSISEAENIAHNLTILTLKLLNQREPNTTQIQPTSIVMDGGNL
jgi:predicted metalloprotease